MNTMKVILFSKNKIIAYRGALMIECRKHPYPLSFPCPKDKADTLSLIKKISGTVYRKAFRRNNKRHETSCKNIIYLLFVSIYGPGGILWGRKW